MNLCMDVGNTKAKLAVFGKDDKLVADLTSKNVGIRKVGQINKKYSILSGIISSTRNLDPEFIDKVRKLFPLIVLSEQTIVPIQSEYETPATLGKDRLAAVVAAYRLYSDETVLVVDIGTCITYDIIDRGTYKGGNISPGIHLRIEAMHRYTDKLPRVPFKINNDIEGKSTVKALQNGAFHGTKGEIDSFIREFKKKYASLKVIFTGGDAQIMAGSIDFPVEVRPLLVLEGLNEILKYNAA